jgi:hypothetical protein
MLPGFNDVVASSHTFGSWHTGALASDANQLAAMPSLHMAWAVWCSLVLWQLSERRVVRALAVAYPLLTTFAVLATGNHFVLDVLAGVAVLALAVLLVRAWERVRAGSRVQLRLPAPPPSLLPRALRDALPSGAQQPRPRAVERGLQKAFETPAE